MLHPLWAIWVAEALGKRAGGPSEAARGVSCDDLVIGPALLAEPRFVRVPVATDARTRVSELERVHLFLSAARRDLRKAILIRRFASPP